MARILLVDDDPSIRGMMAAALEAAGHDVAQAANGREAQNLLRERQFHVLVTDIFMPDMDGLELILAMRRSGTPIRIIAISGGSVRFDIDFLKHAKLLGADITLAKPVSPAALRAVCGDHPRGALPATREEPVAS